jgi:predicted MFS family arabinose efflux permease
MSDVKRALENRIRGWLPKEPSRQNPQMKAAADSSRAFKLLWYAIVFVFLALIIAAVIMFYIPFLAEGFVNRTLALVIYGMVAFVFYRAYGRDYYKRHPKESRAVFVACSGFASGFMISALLVALLGQPLPRTYSLLLFFGFVGVGALVGDKAGRKLGLY